MIAPEASAHFKERRTQHRSETARPVDADAEAFPIIRMNLPF
jgi:hypothetical protein